MQKEEGRAHEKRAGVQPVQIQEREQREELKGEVCVRAAGNSACMECTTCICLCGTESRISHLRRRPF